MLICNNCCSFNCLDCWPGLTTPRCGGFSHSEPGELSKMDVFRSLATVSTSNIPIVFSNININIIQSSSPEKAIQILEEKINNWTTMRTMSCRPFTMIVEGNIGSGKSTFLRHFSKLSKSVDIITEPVDKWRNLNSQNMLQMMYDDPKRQVNS